MDDCLVGLVLGVDFEEHRLPVVRAIASVFKADNSVAHLYLSSGILTPFPVRDAQGSWRKWSEDDLRAHGTVFEEQEDR